VSVRDLTYWYWLRDVKGVGPLRHRLLLRAFGSPERIFEAGPQDYLQVEHVGKKLANSLEDSKNNLHRARRRLEAELKAASKLRARIMTIDEPDYPTLLKDEEAVAPIILYVLGNVSNIPGRAIAMVGSRRASHDAQARTQVLAGQFATGGWGVVSGLALGIDSAAHKGALEAQGCTIAVLGCGLDFFYPPENRSLQRRIAERGAVISEYPLGTRPLGEFLRKRNKLIVALSEAVILAECPAESGALIAAKEAEDRNKPTFAFVPSGSVTQSSEGSAALIREGRAYGLRDDHSLEDVATAMSRYREPKVCVLFDLDGVLADSSGIMIKGYQKAISTVLNRKVRSSELRAVLGLSPRTVLRQHDESRVDELETAYRRYFDQHYASEVRIRSNVQDVVTKLSGVGIPMGVVTSRNKTDTVRILRSLGLEGRMSVMVTWGSTPRKKPYPDPVLLALRQMPMSCQEAAYVGDRPEDVQAARAAGVTSVAASWYGSSNADDLKAENPDYLFKTPGRLFDLVMRLHREAWAHSHDERGLTNNG